MDGRVMVEKSGRMWSTGEGNSKVQAIEDIKNAAQIEFLELKTIMSKMKNTE